MPRREDSEEGPPPSKITNRTPPGRGRPTWLRSPLFSMSELSTKATDMTFTRPGPRPGPGPGPSCLSFMSDWSRETPPTFSAEIPRPGPGPGAGPSCLSFVSDWAKDKPPNFSAETPRPGPGPGPSCLSFMSDWSRDTPPTFSAETMEPHISDVPPDPQHQTQLEFIFKLLEENIITFVKKELKTLQKALSTNHPKHFENLKDEDEEQTRSRQGADKEQTRSSEAFLKITLDFLRRMKHEELAQQLHSRSHSGAHQRKMKRNLQQKFQRVFEGIANAGNPKTLLNQIYTELYITEGGDTGVNQEHEVRQIETASLNPHRPQATITCRDIFKRPPDRDHPIRTMLTKGVAGIGKTVLTQKFSLDWAEDKANWAIDFIFPFTFRELNVLKQKKFSLVELVHHFFPEIKDAGTWIWEDFQVVFILDGLDECRPPLDFSNTQTLTDLTESASVDVLLMNIIRGNLLPSALLWITTRPAAANQIPAQCIDMVTEVRGFTDPQKEVYFRKRFTDERLTNNIISHINRSRSVHIMCHIPVFCWITATVLEHVLKTTEKRQLPSTLTEMYIHFLVVQTKVKNIKYDGGSETEPPRTPETRKMIESLGKLAFEQLQKGNLIFYEIDLAECGIDIMSASVYSGVFTQVFIEQKGLYQERVFCFVHLSVQEFLAALHVHQTFTYTGINLLSQTHDDKETFYKTAVDKALQSPNGHLDLVLRFLLGLSLPSNQRLIQSLVTPTESSLDTRHITVQYINMKISHNQTAERSINLFHCLNELNDRCLVDKIQQSLSSGRLAAERVSPAGWSALAFILLSSKKDLDVFDLQKYYPSDEVLLRLLPVFKVSKRALLMDCHLTDRSCEALSSALRSSGLTYLDLSNNDLKDSGVKILSEGLKSPGCKLETLRLSGCMVTEEGCSYLISALKSNPSRLQLLDLSYNHPGASVPGLLALLEDPRCVDILGLKPHGIHLLKEGPRKYACDLTLNPDTANRKLQLSEDGRKVKHVAQILDYPAHQDRFDYLHQVLCSSALSGRCYWEVELSGSVCIAVTYRGISRKGRDGSCMFGYNNQSWSLRCNQSRYSLCHDNVYVDVPQSPTKATSGPSRVSVLVDCDAGSLSFYRVVFDRQVHLHTFKATFTQPLFVGFGLDLDSSVHLCDIKDKRQHAQGVFPMWEP